MRALIQKDTCNQVFTVALLTIDKTWKQPIRGLDKDDVAHIHDEYAIKKNKLKKE